MSKNVDDMKDEELRRYIRDDLEHKQQLRDNMKKMQPFWICFAVISIIISLISIIWMMQPIDYGW